MYRWAVKYSRAALQRRHPGRHEAGKYIAGEGSERGAGMGIRFRACSVPGGGPGAAATRETNLDPFGRHWLTAGGWADVSPGSEGRQDGAAAARETGLNSSGCDLVS